MKLKDIYNFVVKEGIEVDPRGKKAAQKDLEQIKQSYEQLKAKEQKEFDRERLTNPYSDTRILYGEQERLVKRILIGIDIGVGEILLADRLNEKAKTIDLVISHHPAGKALADFYKVMHMQLDILAGVGVPISIVEDLLEERIREVERRVSSLNHTRAVDVAKVLNIPFMCVHTPADNHVASFLQKLMDSKKPETVGKVMEILKEIPEYEQAVRCNTGPKIIKGTKERRTGKVFVDMTGGTEVPKNIFERLSQAGVGTLVSMHLSEEHFKRAEREHINIIVAGHIASDNLGLNLLLDKLEKKSKMEIISCSGFQRVKRKRE